MSAYARPESLAEAFELLRQDGAVPLAGGTDLAGQVDRGISRPRLLVDLQDVGLATIERDNGIVRIGATATLADVAAADLLKPYAAVVEAASHAASPLLRNVGTVGGNLCQHTAAGTTAASSGRAGWAEATPATRRSETIENTTSSRGTVSPPTHRISRRRSRRAVRTRRSPGRTGIGTFPCWTCTGGRPRTTAHS